MDKTVLITGASSGIGYHTALSFNKKGYQLILLSRRRDRLQELESKLTVPFHTIVADVRDADAFEKALLKRPKEFQDIDVLVNNAGLALGRDPTQNASLKDWETMVDTNIKGLLYCTHTLLPQMVAQNKGHIINLGSIAALYPYAGGNVYGATKSFVHQFSKNIRADLLGTNVRVTIIAPGIVETEFFNVRFKGDNTKADAVFEGFTPLNPEDIAAAILWATEQPPHVNVNLIELMPMRQAPGDLTPRRS
ncbi:MAG: SDR family NAD(P)-dependent oxidoreductase [Alphaproteobacteria bacterium]|nr:SDR family NAD(P)-dependent oxidoreductase [Alphaproteobacteria bacterium]